MKRKATLPKHISDGILLAIEDLKKAEKSKQYSIDMSLWHRRWHGDSTCSVCFAGSVMAFSLGAEADEETYPWDFSDPTQRKLEALNYARMGSISVAVGTWYSRVSKAKLEAADKLDFDPVDYTEDPAKFKRQMRSVAKKLAQIGL